MTFTPSPQQADFLNWVSNGSGSCVLEAVAGAGKTTTLLEAVDRTGGGVAILAYNKMIAEEIKGKLLKRGVDWKTAEAGTVHSFGFRAYRKAFPKVQVEGGKTFAVLDQMFKGAPAHHISRTHGAGIANLVSLAKQRAIGVTGSIDNRKLWNDIVDHFGLFGDDGDDMIEDLIEVAIAALKTSNLTTDVIDFDDMVYLPLVHKVRFWRYKWVFVDEAQDTNPARRALVKAILAPFGRVVAVGDRAQAIYGFTGADADSLDLIADEFNAVRMPLTTTYRCPKAVVSFAQRWVSHITAADTAPEGEVLSIEAREFFERQDLGRGSAVLCRNTAPIISLAFQLIRQGIGCRVEGRDIGQGLIKLATKWKTVKTLAGLESALEKWADRQIARAQAKNAAAVAQTIADQRETLQVVIDRCREQKRDGIDHVVAAIKGIFEDNVTGMLVLSTIHKSKGREWDTVFWLDRDGTLPSKYARQKWQLQQEDNLCYVAATRAKQCLIEVVI